MGFLGFERRWLSVILPAYASAPEAEEGAGRLSLVEGEVDWLAAADAMFARSHPQAKFGMHLATWVVYFAPLFLGGGAATMRGLSPEARGLFLSRMLGDSRLLVRGMALMLKLTACMAMFKSGSLRSRSGYDREALRFWSGRKGLPIAQMEAP